MNFRPLTDTYSVSPQLSVADVETAAQQGFRAIVCARPDGEEAGQPSAEDIERAAVAAGLTFEAIPVPSGLLPDAAAIERMKIVLKGVDGPVLGYCRSGMRAAHLWALAQAGARPEEEILDIGRKAGLNLSPLSERLKQAAGSADISRVPGRRFDVVVVGGGAAGLSIAAGLLKRKPGLSVAIIEPSPDHFYQPGWTLVGGGVFRANQTRRPESSLIPRGAEWIRTSVERIDPDNRLVGVADGGDLSYSALVLAAGIVLDWGAIDGLEATLGHNGVTSNYRYDLAPYTWELVQNISSGRAIFTQPPMPIKCAGAPQKAMYLSCDAWRRRGVLNTMEVEFDNAGGVLFGVPAFVPPLMEYVHAYGINLKFNSRLVAVDGPNRIATFERTGANGPERIQTSFDMLHVVPPQIAPAFVRQSGLAGADGFVAVNPATLQHISYPNIFAAGDIAGTSNAKTAAAARKQAPVVIANLLAALEGHAPVAGYDGYGGCPLTVERGKIVLAEFGYGGKLLPSLPKWLLDGTKPTRLAWFLKKDVMPILYWQMLRGHEIMVKPEPAPKS